MGVACNPPHSHSMRQIQRHSRSPYKAGDCVRVYAFQMREIRQHGELQQHVRDLEALFQERRVRLLPFEPGVLLLHYSTHLVRHS